MLFPAKYPAVALLALLVACASGQTTLRTEPSGNVPLVQITNDTYSEAVIYMDGVRLANVRGSETVLFPIRPAQIAADGQIHFAVRLISTGETANLPVVEYREGQKVRLTLKPLLSASTAY